MTTVSQAAAPKLRLTRVRIITIAAAIDRSSRHVVRASARVAPRGRRRRRRDCAVRADRRADDRPRARPGRRRGARANDAPGGRRVGRRSSPAQIVRAAQDAAAVLAGAAARPTVLQIEERDGETWLVGPDPGRGDDQLQLPLALLPNDVSINSSGV